MKTRTIIAAAIAFAAMFVWCCGKDEITDLDQNGQNPNTDPDTGQYDYIDSVWFNRTISVVFSQSGQATVTGATSDFAVTINGNGVTIVNNGTDKVRYELSGSTSNGFLKIYSGKRQALIFNNVNITNPVGSAINIQGLPDSLSKAKRTFVVLNGSNALGDGASYTATPSNEDEKAAFFSESPLIFSGSGNLTVTAIGKSGIATDDYLRINEGNITVNMTSQAKVISGDTLKPACLKGKEEFIIVGGTLTLSSSGTGAKGISGDSIATFAGGTVTVNVTGSNFGSSGGSGGGFPRPGQQSNNGVSAKGIKFDKSIIFSGGNVSVSCSSHEGIESKGTITISGGVVYSYSSADDAINSSSDFSVTGGFVGFHSTKNDAMDANGNMYIRGGVVYSVTTAGSPEVSLDANTEGGKRLYVEGGTLIVVGGLESGSQLTQNCYQASSITSNTWYSITVGSDTYAFKTPTFSTSGGGFNPGGGSRTPTLVVSGSEQPTVKSGVTVNGGTNYFNNTFTVGGNVSGGSQVSLSNYSSGGGFF